jgi:FkbM family methyltransferase
MNLRVAAVSAARLIAPLFSFRAAQTGLENGKRFLEALQGIGTGGQFSHRELDAVFAELKESSPVIFDVGAHTGQFLNEALKRSSSGCVIHAFEPAASSFRKLSAAFAEDMRVQLNRAALSRLVGSGVLFYDEPASQLASLTARRIFGNAKSEGVRLDTIDEYCSQNEIDKIDLLKLDVEGHELEVLQGSTDMLRREAIYQILFEFGGCAVDTRVFFRDLYGLLTSNGFRIARVMPGGRFLPIEIYDEHLERFRTTNYLATLRPLK